MSDYIIVHGIRIATDFVPETFGRLTTIGPRFRIGSKAYQVCQCSCGNIKVARTDHLVRGSVVSCGCYHSEVSSRVGKSMRKHGEGHRTSTTPEYVAWLRMRSRCNNPKDKSYPDYGGRGITVCKRWDNLDGGYQNFLADMGRRPPEAESIDRKRNNEGYYPENCHWADRHTQNRNKRSNVHMTAFGKTQVVKDWAIEYGINYKCLWKRLKRGWDLETALLTPSGQKPTSKPPI